MTEFTRRSLLEGAALAGATATLPQSAQAAAPRRRQAGAGFYRYKIGSYELTAIHDGVWMRDIDDKFVRNAPWAAVQKAMTDAHMPEGKLAIPFTTLVVNTGSKLDPDRHRDRRPARRHRGLVRRQPGRRRHRSESRSTRS